MGLSVHIAAVSGLCSLPQPTLMVLGLGLGPFWLQADRQSAGSSQGRPEASPVVCLLCLITRQLFNYASCMPAFIVL
jgi:hypothetical protein